MDRTKQLGEENIDKLLIKFSIPAIVGMLVNALYNVVDRIFVGRVDKLALSGVAATAITTTGFVIIQLFPKEFISIFNKDPELIDIGVRGIRIYLFMIPVIGFQIISSNYFQAIGKAKISIFLGLSRQVIILIPLLFILPRFLGLDGVWASAPSSDVISSIITAIFLFIEIRHLNKLHGEDKDVII